jgi:hypothetical protein
MKLNFLVFILKKLESAGSLGWGLKKKSSADRKCYIYEENIHLNQKAKIGPQSPNTEFEAKISMVVIYIDWEFYTDEKNVHLWGSKRQKKVHRAQKRHSEPKISIVV